MATYANLTAAQTAYLANADYADGSGDQTKAQAFQSACRALLVLLPASVRQGTATRSMNITAISTELAQVKVWLAGNVSARVTYADVREFRDNLRST